MFGPFSSSSFFWAGIVIVAYLITSAVQLLVIFPIELSLFGKNTVFASFLFLPHAVRVLSAWLLGPKSLLAIIPAGIAVSWLSGNLHGYLGEEFSTQVLIYIFADCSAVVAFEFMRLCKIDAYPKTIGVISWRTVLFGGILASVINSIGSTWLRVFYIDPSSILEVISRFMLGDTLGLMLGMFSIMIVFKLIRNK
ncbi:hypothetical protein OAP51_03435 [Alphaproteobacteria bacterium]|nr:hypothetical protein [Alphaproteobacteria bacterium]